MDSNSYRVKGDQINVLKIFNYLTLDRPLKVSISNFMIVIICE